MILKGKRIFVVEDNVQNRIVFQMALASAGALVEFERWGKDAITGLQYNKNVDLIILDLMLYGGVSGYDIFNAVRKLPEFAHIPIIAVSASEPATAIPKTRAMGFNGFIGKPIDMELLPEQIVRIIAGEKLWYTGSIYTGVAEETASES